jgi:NADH dehydrogenase/NADH:ubiquinone oxidoreductase subunit G
VSENQKPNLITLTIDGQEVKVAAGTSLIKAAQKVSKEIPHFCYHEGLSVVGQCRMCFVEIEGSPKLATACSTPASEGMKVLTQSPKVKAGQNATLEFTLLNHPLDCPICDRGGECKLQDYTYEFGPPLSRLYDDKVLRDKHRPVSEQVILDQERCILCTRCVRFSGEVDGRGELVVNNRGNANVIDVFEGRPMESRFSGNVVDLCPVGALTAKDFRFEARPWELVKHEGICTGCSVGCNIEIHTKHRHTGIVRPDGLNPEPQIERLMPRENRSVNDWWMCDKGRWGYHFHNSGDSRLRNILVRKGSSLENSSLKEVQTAIESQAGEWNFWISDDLPHEGIAWAKELQQSWKSRGRNVKGLNSSPLAEKFLSVWKSKSAPTAFFNAPKWNEIQKVVCTHTVRDLETIAPILALRLGQKVRSKTLEWEVRGFDSQFIKSTDNKLSTAFLFAAPKNIRELDTFSAFDADLKTLPLFERSNSRGLLGEGIVPVECIAQDLLTVNTPERLFVFSQTTQNPIPKAFVEYCKKAKFLIVADSFQNELTKIANVVLPLSPLFETPSTLTNLENIQQLSKGIHIEHPNWEYLSRGSSLVNPSLKLI